MVQALTAQGYLTPDEKGVLQLNDLSRAVLFSGRRVAMRKELKSRKDAANEELLKALQRLRYNISAREYVAASALFSDSTLRDLCRILPRTKKELAAVDGMGLFKANRYGDQILQLIRLIAPPPKEEKKKQAKQKQPSAEKGSFASYKDKVIAKGSTEAYQPWTKEEDRQLTREFEEGKTTKELSVIHKRTTGAIRSRLKKLELIT